MLHMQHIAAQDSSGGLPALGDEVIGEMGSTCLLMRTRLISRVVTAIHDEELRPFGIGSPQFVLLVVIFKLQPATRAEIGRFHHQDRSTLTRNLKIILAEGWAEESPNSRGGRARPIVLTEAGKSLLLEAQPTWRVAQERTKALLGEAGAVAITDIADAILGSPGAS